MVIEERIALYARVNEAQADHIVHTACAALNLDEPDKQLCNVMTTGQSGETIAWSALQLRVDIDKANKDTLSFSERVCAEQNHCDIWIDKDAFQVIFDEKSFEAVYN